MSSRLISLEARERLRTQQAAEVKAVSAHAVACTRLEGVLGKRAELLAAQDLAVTSAEADVAVAAAGVVAVSGFARAAALLGSSPASLRRQLAVAKSRAQGPAEHPDRGRSLR